MSYYTVMTVCGKKCSYDCLDYKTPIEQCYRPTALFPGDPQWGDYDIKDQRVSDSTLRRSFYQSKDGTCSRPAEVVDIPLHTDLWPMGDPRPCGRFRVEEYHTPLGSK